MIAHSIETALVSGIFDRVLVSTDDEEIAKISESFGAETPFTRPKNLADEHTGTTAVILHALDWLHQEQQETPDFVCCLYATAPLLRAQSLIEGHIALAEENYESAISVGKFPSSIFRALQLSKENSLLELWPEYRLQRSQDLPVTYFDAGQFYWSKRDRLITEKRFLSKKTKPIVLPRDRVQDIDTPEDWKFAELLYDYLRSAPNRDS